MARRKISRSPANTNYYLVDACFLANRFVPIKTAPDPEKERIKKCSEWWKEIDSQVRKKKAIVYVPDICIAEAFKVIAKKYYREKRFKNAKAFAKARRRLMKFVSTPTKTLKATDRHIRCHDISTCRDVIIAVDRFFELFMKHGHHNASLPDLIILATAKYLLDFYRLTPESLIIVTMDTALHAGSKKTSDIPSAYNPTLKNESADVVFQ